MVFVLGKGGGVSPQPVNQRCWWSRVRRMGIGVMVVVVGIGSEGRGGSCCGGVVVEAEAEEEGWARPPGVGDDEGFCACSA